MENGCNRKLNVLVNTSHAAGRIYRVYVHVWSIFSTL